MKGLFLKALEAGWRIEKSKGLKVINRQELVSNAVKMLGALGDSMMTEKDINEVIDKVWGKDA